MASTLGWTARRGIVTGLLAAVLVTWTAGASFAAGGELDPAFSGQGWVATNFTSGEDLAYDVAISADGRIVAVGRAAGGPGRFAVARYLPGGALDPSFGGDGRVITDFPSDAESAQGVAIQPDGKVVVAGWATGGGGRIALARYRTNGTLDPTFGGGDGKVVTNLTPGDDYAWAVAIQPLDEKIVVVGGAGGAGGRFLVARYGSTGSLDGTFSGNGWILTDFTSKYDYVDALTIQPDGKIVAAGSTNYYGSTPRFALARYTTGGSLDATFSGDGKLTTNFAPGTAWAFGVAVQEDDKIVAAGQTGLNTALARYLPDGSLDASFGGGDGRVIVNFGAGEDFADEVMLQLDGRIVTVGTSRLTEDASFAVGRFLSDGTPDPSFSGDGKVLNNISFGRDWAFGAALQPPEGKIVLAGRTTKGGGRFVIARYLVA